MSDLPQSWKKTKLGDLFEFSYGKSLPDRVRSGNGFPVYGSNGVVGYHNLALTKGETIIIGRKGSVGEVHYSPLPCFPIDTTYYIEQFDEMPAKFWYYRLKSANLGSLNKATAIPGLNRNDAYNISISVPPLPEQKRIADKLDALLARVEQCQTHLDRVPALLKAFRQSVLAAATSGRLTEDWREENSVIGNWRLVKLSDVATSRLGKMLDAAKNRGELRPYLRNINVRWFDFDLNNIQELRISDDEAKTLTVRKGDVLVCEGGEPGRCAVWHGEDDRYLFQKALHLIRVGEKLLPEWICYSLKAAADSGSLADYFTGTTIKHFTGVSLSQFEFGLPSIEEQHEIVRRVERLFAFGERLEARWRAAQGQVAALTPSLLAKAFRGELV